MGESYKMVDMGIHALVGRKVKKASINAEKDCVVLDCEDGRLYLTWIGECCATCYLAHVNGIDNLFAETITAADHSGWVDVKRDENYEVVESMGTKIITTKGFVDFESRVEHNGYYGGEIMISDDEPIGMYHSPKYPTDEEKKEFVMELKGLRDF